ncbi:hypothetical protein [Streptomyces sp. RKAG337]|uniref:hypothetical protein n=1 Tax=Streptomyces sp. RKAG337 TaxID=2893404 RepID=UPI00203361B2|nr:hypothetical protein [Streptomyces sp. RKAG337]MCM2431087.1 hypothetical protein [Streptomyces sp. RKAG337]
MNALSLTAGQRVVTIHSNTPGVTDWATRYFGRYWKASPPEGSTAVTGPVVTVMDGDHRAPVAGSHTQHAVFAREPIGYTRHPDGTVSAHTLSDPPLAFHYAPPSSTCGSAANKPCRRQPRRAGRHGWRPPPPASPAR